MKADRVFALFNNPYVRGVLWGIVVPVLFFATQLRSHDRNAGWPVLLLAISAAAWVLNTVRIGTGSRAIPVPRLVLRVLSTSLWLVVSFTIVYWNLGTSRNFSQPLSHMDATYFTLGTLTTAGTGSISPTSQTARLLVTVQYGVDLIFVFIVLAVLVSRLALDHKAPG